MFYPLVVERLFETAEVVERLFETAETLSLAWMFAYNIGCFGQLSLVDKGSECSV